MNDTAAVIEEQLDIEGAAEPEGGGESTITPEGEQAAAEGGDTVELTEAQKLENETAEFNPAQQLVLEKAIGRQTKLRGTAERETLDLRQQLAAAQAQIPEVVRPVIPEMPDQFDDNYQEKMVAREAATREAWEFEQNEQRQTLYNQELERQIQQAQQEAVRKASNEFGARGEKLGINQVEQQAAWVAIANSGLDPNVTAFILQDEQGPNINRYLQKNPQVLDGLAGMHPMNAVAAIASDIRAKAIAGGVTVDPPPPPAENANAAGFQEGERGPKGATYE